MAEEELIITTVPLTTVETTNTTINVPIPSSLPITTLHLPTPPSLPIDTLPTSPLYTPYNLPMNSTNSNDIKTPSHSFFNFVTLTENKNFIIHVVCDVILFYMCFKYINSMYNKTRSIIYNCKKSISSLKEQYGLLL